MRILNVNHLENGTIFLMIECNLLFKKSDASWGSSVVVGFGVCVESNEETDRSSLH